MESDCIFNPLASKEPYDFMSLVASLHNSFNLLWTLVYESNFGIGNSNGSYSHNSLIGTTDLN